MNIAAICFSKYQLINIINYIKKYNINDNKIDLFIDYRVLSNDEISRLKELNKFTNIILYKDFEKPFILKKIFFRIKGIINPLFTIKQLLIYKGDFAKVSESYDECIFSFQFMLSIALCFITNRNNIHMIEDGAVSYFSYNVEDRFVTNLFYAVLCRSLKKINPKRLYVNNKSLVVDEVATKFIEVLNLDVIDDVLFKELCYLFSFDLNMAENYNAYKIIYFNQPNDFKIKDYYLVEDRICCMLHKYRHSLYRLHPRNRNKSFYYDNLQIDSATNMWDLSSKCISNDILLISSFSTSLFSPKLLFGKEPYLIFTSCLYNNFFKDKNIINNLFSFIDRFKNSYHDKSKICIISDYNELSSIINKFYSNIDLS